MSILKRKIINNNNYVVSSRSKNKSNLPVDLTSEEIVFDFPDKDDTPSNIDIQIAKGESTLPFVDSSIDLLSLEKNIKKTNLRNDGTIDVVGLRGIGSGTSTHNFNNNKDNNNYNIGYKYNGNDGNDDLEFDNEYSRKEYLECCDCSECNCNCHAWSLKKRHISDLKIKAEDIVRYLFDYTLFKVPNNFERCGFLYIYLLSEGILDLSCIISKESCNVVGPFTKPNPHNKRQKNIERVSELDSVNTYVDRNKNGELHFTMPSNVIDPINVTDIRMLFRNIILTENTSEWLQIKTALQFPSILLYIKLQGSHVEINADRTWEFFLADLRNLSESLGHKLAKIIAWFRKVYFNIPVPDFTKLQKDFEMQMTQKKLNTSRIYDNK